MTTVIIGVQPDFAAIWSARPFFEITIEPAAADGLVTHGLAVLRMFIMLGIVLYVGMYAILFVAEDIIPVCNTFQQIDGFLAFAPGLFGKLNTARGCKGCNLVLHIGNAMVDQHGAHREPRPIHAFLVNVEFVGHLVDGLDDEVLVIRAAHVPRTTVATQVGDDKFCRVDHLVHLVRAILVFRILVHTVCHDEEWRFGWQLIGGENHHVS